MGTGSLPSGQSKLAAMKFFDISNNKLSGTLPPDLFQMPNPQNIKLEGNKFVGTLPSEFGKLSLLEDFFCENPQLSGTLPDSFFSFTKGWRFTLNQIRFLELLVR